MPEVKDVLRFLELVERNQPIHAYGLALVLGNPKYVAVAWKWLHYFEELGVVKKVTDAGYKTGRKEYKLTEKGEKLLEILRMVWSDKRTLTVSSFSRKRA
ncbi:MAG: hypothetical protein J7K45_01525 [Thaumarchaeota archaeon]|nr:hypothetical protein [Nitrososphaerota archaeon]